MLPAWEADCEAALSANPTGVAAAATAPPTVARNCRRLTVNPVSDVNTRDPPDMKARHVVASEFWRLIIRRAISKSDEKVAGICNRRAAASLIERKFGSE
jgi:hypothetical protein